MNEWLLRVPAMSTSVFIAYYGRPPRMTGEFDAYDVEQLGAMCGMQFLEVTEPGDDIRSWNERQPACET